MPHTKEKKMINTNRAVLVKFESNTNTNQVTSSGEADIYVPFESNTIYSKIMPSSRSSQPNEANK